MNEHASDFDPEPAKLPTLQQLQDEAANLSDFERRRRAREVIQLLAAESVQTQQDYRDTLVKYKYIRPGDFISTLADAKKQVELQERNRAGAGGSYFSGEDGFLYFNNGSGQPLLIARFVPQVVADIVRDDGAERVQLTRMRVTVPNGRSGEVDVTPEKLRDARVWSVQAAGPAAAIMAVSRAPEHVLAAAQILGAVHERQVIYAHTGWRQIDGAWRFLTSSGALGAADMDTSVTVDLGSAALNRYRLPDPGEVPLDELRAAVRASIDLRSVVPLALSAPQLGAVYRAPLPLQPDCTVWVVGLSGLGKSAFVALCQQHYGAEMDAKHLPGSWSSTGNDLESTAFALANVTFVVDDYNPQGTERDQAAMRQAAERLIRGAANGAGRGRLNRDGTPAPRRYPRAQVLATGEDVAPGHSLRARMIIAQAETDLIKGIAERNVQKLGADGTYALAMSGYVQFLAKRCDAEPDFPRALAAGVDEYRGELANDGRHRRVAEGVASLLLGWRMWLEYAVDVGAVNESEACATFEEVRNTLVSLSDEQDTHQRDTDPVRIWGRSLVAAVTAGDAYLADPRTGGPPESPERWGWASVPVSIGAGGTDWRPRGRCIGWISGEGVYLHKDVAHQVAREYAEKLGTPVGFRPVMIRKQLHQAGLLVVGDDKNLTVARSILGTRKRVLHVKWDDLSE